MAYFSPQLLDKGAGRLSLTRRHSTQIRLPLVFKKARPGASAAQEARELDSALLRGSPTRDTALPRGRNDWQREPSWTLFWGARETGAQPEPQKFHDAEKETGELYREKGKRRKVSAL